RGSRRAAALPHRRSHPDTAARLRRPVGAWHPAAGGGARAGRLSRRAHGDSARRWAGDDDDPLRGSGTVKVVAKRHMAIGACVLVRYARHALDDVGAQSVKRGLALAAPSGYGRAAAYQEAQALAQAGRRGLWSSACASTVRAMQVDGGTRETAAAADGAAAK